MNAKYHLLFLIERVSVRFLQGSTSGGSLCSIVMDLALTVLLPKVRRSGCTQTCIQHCLSHPYRQYSDKFPSPRADIPNSGGKRLREVDAHFPLGSAGTTYSCSSSLIQWHELCSCPH